MPFNFKPWERKQPEFPDQKFIAGAVIGGVLASLASLISPKKVARATATQFRSGTAATKKAFSSIVSSLTPRKTYVHHKRHWLTGAVGSFFAAAVATLFSPKSGKEVRHAIAKTYRSAKAAVRTAPSPKHVVRTVEKKVAPRAAAATRSVKASVKKHTPTHPTHR